MPSDVRQRLPDDPAAFLTPPPPELTRDMDQDTDRSSVDVGLGDLNKVEPEEPPLSCVRHALSCTLVLLLVGVLGLVATHTAETMVLAEGVLAWTESQGCYGPFVVSCIQVVVLVAMMPSWFLWVGSGAVFSHIWGHTWGIFAATSAASAGVWAGSICAFVLGRFLLREQVLAWVETKMIFRAIDLAVLQRGLFVGFLMKISPAMPVNVINYVLSVTHIKLTHFVVTCPGSFLSVFVYVLLGASLGSLSGMGKKEVLSGDSKDMMTYVTIGGAVVCVVSLVIVARMSKHAYAEIMARAQTIATVAQTPDGKLDTQRAKRFSLLPEDYGTPKDPLVALGTRFISDAQRATLGLRSMLTPRSRRRATLNHTPRSRISHTDSRGVRGTPGDLSLIPVKESSSKTEAGLLTTQSDSDRAGRDSLHEARIKSMLDRKSAPPRRYLPRDGRPLGGQGSAREVGLEHAAG